MLEKTLESPLDYKEIQPVHPKGNWSWIFIGRTDTGTEALILWLPHVKTWLIRKDSDSGKDWRQEEKGMTEDEMVGWRHWLDGYKFGQALGVDDGPGSLACLGLQRVGRDWTELNWGFQHVNFWGRNSILNYIYMPIFIYIYICPWLRVVFGLGKWVISPALSACHTCGWRNVWGKEVTAVGIWVCILRNAKCQGSLSGAPGVSDTL